MNHSRSCSGNGGTGARLRRRRWRSVPGLGVERGKAIGEGIVGWSGRAAPFRVARPAQRSAGRRRCAARAPARHRARSRHVPGRAPRSPARSAAHGSRPARRSAPDLVLAARETACCCARSPRDPARAPSPACFRRGRCPARGRHARGCRETRPRRCATVPSGAGSAGRCSARRTTSAASAPAGRRPPLPS